ncbi:MAG: hypothetical protein WBM59_00325 [Sedimenticolaceae bacterium]
MLADHAGACGAVPANPLDDFILGEEMQYENEINVRLNQYGEPDVEYYLANAHQIRSQAIGTWLKAFAQWVTRTLDDAWFPDQQHQKPLQRVVQSDWPWVDMIMQGTNRKAGHA